MFEDYERKKARRNIILTLLSSLGIGVLLFVLAIAYFSRNASQPPAQQPLPQNQSQPQPPQPQQIATEIQSAVGTPTAAAVAKNASAGVVGISVLKADSSALFDPKATDKWEVGSGVIVSPNGYILTNNHVAGGSNKRLVVSLIDGRNIDGTTAWADPVLDLAIVKINADNLPTIPLGDANTLQVGEPAIAIGNPLGLQFQRTVTSGIISALNRTIQISSEQGGSNYMEDLIQTDASINPGNSGGPLLNSKGQVVGINTIKVTSAEGMGFAVPINAAIPAINKFVSKGQFTETYMGIFAYDKDVIPYLNSSIKLDNGIYVSNVDEAGPAYRSGIHVGCIITKVDGIPMNTMMQLRAYIYSKEPGDTINVTHLSQGKEMTVPVRLAAKVDSNTITR